MTPAEILQHPHVAPSTAWKAVEKLLGLGAKVYEPETLQIELGRRGVEWTPERAAKILGAQTILVSRTWTYDYNVLFAFALACGGSPASSDAHHHPEVHDLAWAMLEIEALTGQQPCDDHGFDPDNIDPAIAVVLHDDGWVLTPDVLRFAQDALDRQNGEHHTELRDQTRERWEMLKPTPEKSGRAVFDEVPESALKAQLRHLYDCQMEIAARSKLREEQRRELL